MDLKLTVLVVTVLVFLYSVDSLAAKKITLVSFPVNVTSWKRQLQDQWRHPLETLRANLNSFRDMNNNKSATCAQEGAECSAEVSDCCSVIEGDLECLPSDDSDTYVCRRLQSSEELAAQRLSSLQYGDSKGVINSHPWLNSWEYQSKSTMEREEERAAEDSDFTRNFKSANESSIWKKIYTTLKDGGENLCNNIRMLEKLREIKNKLIEKYSKKNKTNYEPIKEEKEAEVPEYVPKLETLQDNLAASSTSEAPKDDRILESEVDDSWLYTRYSSKEGRGDEDIFGRFSDQHSRRRNPQRIDLRIEDIINDIITLLYNKLKEKMEKTKTLEEHSHRPLGNDIMDSAEGLKKEIEELKALKEKRMKNKKEGKLSDLINNDEIIKKHVAVILDEERKLDKLKKLEELKKAAINS